MYDLIRPNSARLHFWLVSYFPFAMFALLHVVFWATRGALPLFVQYSEIRNYLGEPELWVRFAAAFLYLAGLFIYVVLFVGMLRKHIRNLKYVFSYTEGSTLGWMWWNIGLVVIKGIAVMLMITMEGQIAKIVCFFILTIEPIITTIWVLRQKDLYDEPIKKDEQSKGFLFEKEPANAFELSPEKRTVLKQSLLKLLEKDEIFKDPELNSEKVRAMLATNRTYLSRIINQDMDTSFYNLVNTYRLNKAVELMKDPQHQNTPLKIIADICGFKSLSAFSTFFKQTYGITPTEWQRDVGVES
jgi:AraC-like DNA-binding protein